MKNDQRRKTQMRGRAGLNKRRTDGDREGNSDQRTKNKASVANGRGGGGPQTQPDVNTKPGIWVSGTYAHHSKIYYYLSAFVLCSFEQVDG